MKIQNKNGPFQGFFLHDYVMLVFMFFFSGWMLSCNLLIDSLPEFVFELPVASLFFLVSTVAVFFGFSFSPLVRQYREQLVLVLSLLYCGYLATGIYQCNYDFHLIAVLGVYVVITGSYFTNYRYVTILLATTFVSLGIVHLALPAEVVGYPFWTYLVFVPMMMLAYYYVISQSIFTHRRLVESERNLLLKTRELNTVLDSLSAMVAHIDRENRLISANQAVADFFGKEKSEILGKSLWELMPYAAAAPLCQENSRIMESGQGTKNVVEKMPHPKLHKDIWLKKTKVPFYGENGEIAGIVYSSEEVTDQVVSELKLRESEERFRMIFEKAPDGMGLIDMPTNQFVKVNRALSNMVGVPENELIGVTPADLAHPDDRNLSLPVYHEAINHNQFDYAIEQRLVHCNGQVITCRLSMHVVRENGQPKYLICMYRDVSQEREQEVQLKKYAHQLEESNQNLQEFAYAASHDLREPLRTVVSYVQLLQRYLDLENQPAEVSEFMGFIAEGAHRMERQIMALLQYSRVGRGGLDRRKVDLNHSLELVQAMLSMQIAERGAIITSDPLPTVLAEPSQMETVLQNLVCNSLKYQKPGTRPSIHISSQHQDDRWVISVKDNGIGIEQDYLEKIFAVFRRLHTQHEYPGSGVGLAICRRILQRHGGAIWVESGGAGGSTFYFSLAKPDDQARPPAQSAIISRLHAPAK